MGERSDARRGSRRSFKRLARREAVALSLAGLVLLLATAGALAVTGDLTQSAGSAGCVSETGAGPCADGHGLNHPFSVAVSPDGKSVYVASYTGSTVMRLVRNTTTGAITQPAGSAGCVSEDGSGPCADGHGLALPTGVTVSADGKSVYVGSILSDAVARFNRNTTTGAISQPAGSAGCISETGAGPCADGHGLEGAHSVAVSPDGKSVYVGSFASDAVVRLNRNTTTGAIGQPAGSAGCVSEDGAGPCADGHALEVVTGVVVSPDGKSVYATSASSDAVVRLVRDTTTGAISQPAGTAGCISGTGAGPCVDGFALDTPESMAISADGKNVYVASFSRDAVVRLIRDTTTGAITQPAGSAGCIGETGSPCADGRGLNGVFSVAISPDGKSVYVASFYSDTVARLVRDTTTGAITQPPESAGCISQTGAGPCTDGHGLDGSQSVAVSANGQSIYVASADSDAVARLNRAP